MDSGHRQYIERRHAVHGALYPAHVEFVAQDQRETAEHDYRVALAVDGSVDRTATTQLRAMAAAE